MAGSIRLIIILRHEPAISEKRNAAAADRVPWTGCRRAGRPAADAGLIDWLAAALGLPDLPPKGRPNPDRHASAGSRPATPASSAAATTSPHADAARLNASPAWSETSS
jgi:hypothetical protein